MSKTDREHAWHSMKERRRSRSPSGKWEYEPKLLPRTTDPLTVAKLRLWSN
jgi:hypothetical protein